MNTSPQNNTQPTLKPWIAGLIGHDLREPGIYVVPIGTVAPDGLGMNELLIVRGLGKNAVQARAKFILQACNKYEDLRTACQMAFEEASADNRNQLLIDTLDAALS